MAQERLWFLHRLQLGSAYNLLDVAELVGSLKISRLERALATLVARHDELGSRIVEGVTGALWETLPGSRCSLPVVDLRGLPNRLREQEARRIAQAAARWPFLLQREPPLRFLLLRVAAKDGDTLADDLHWLVVVSHHIAVDLWSFGVLFRELALLYGDPAAGLTALPCSYADYAHWQRQRLQGATLEASLDEAKERLRDFPLHLDLPLDHPRPQRETDAGAKLPVRLPPKLASAVNAIASEIRGTPFMVLLAAFGATLHRWTGQRRLLLATPDAGRTERCLEPLVGLFVNTLVMPWQLRTGATFVELLAEVRESGLEVLAQRDLPFDRLVEAVSPSRDLARSPLAQVLFAYQNTPTETLRLPGLEIRSVDIDPGSAIFELSLFLEAVGDRFEGSVEYRCDLFDRTTVMRLREHFLRLLSAAVRAPHEPVEQLSWLSAAQRHQLCFEWSRGGERDSADGLGPLLHSAVLAQADRRPHGIALESTAAGSPRVVTYHQLITTTGRLAEEFRREGVGPGSVVGVLMNRSAERIATLLAVLCTGAAYLPLEPSLPAPRLALLLEDAAPRRVVVDAASAAAARSFVYPITVVSEAIWGGGDSTPAALAPEPWGLSPDALAYVIFTSGSTGRPKAVQCTHRGIVERLRWGQRFDPLTPEDAVVQKTPFSFDVSLWEMFWPLSVGARLILAPPGGEADPRELTRLAASSAATVMHFVPSMLRAFLAAKDLELPSSLRRVLCSGEALEAALVEDLLARWPQVAVHNLYGPTEAAVEVSHWACRRGEDPVPIGRPIDGVTLLVLDDQLRPQPPGVAGQLFIAGAALARGYGGLPRRTAETFLPHPLGEGGERIYGTGDIARWLADGRLIFLGRRDGQVKIRGVRIELGEVEAAMRELPGVAAAAAFVSKRGEARLECCWVPEPGAEGENLREELRSALPAAMVPVAIHPVEALPLTASGKLDRQALAQRAWRSEKPAVRPRSAPRTPLEAAIADLWSEALADEGLTIPQELIPPSEERESGVASLLAGPGMLDVETPLFDLGGHSLSMVRIAARMRQRFGVDLPLAELFRQPTVRGMARLVAGYRGQQSADAIQPRRGSVDEPLPLTLGQQALWSFERNHPGTAAYNLPVPLSIRGELDHRALESALGRLVEEHEILRTAFQEEEGQAVQRVERWPLSSGVPLPMIDLQALDPVLRERTVDELTRIEARRPFEFGRPRPVRWVLLRTGPERHRLLLTLHHLVADGSSLGVALAAVAQGYRSARRGESSPVTPGMQYGDYALWQRSQRARWKQEVEVRAAALQGLSWTWPLLADRPEALASPFAAAGDESRIEAPDDREGSMLPLRFPEGIEAALEALGRRCGTSLFVIMLAIWGAFLARRGAVHRLLLVTPSAIRPDPSLETVIGHFVNLLPVVLELPTRARVEDVVSGAKEALFDALEFAELPFELLLDRLSGDTAGGTAGSEFASTESPLRGVVAFQPPTPALTIPGLDIDFLTVDTQAAKLDLSLVFSHSAYGLAGSMEYRRDRLDGTTVERIARSFQEALQWAAAHPGAPIQQMTIFSEAQRHQLIFEWPPGPRSATVAAAFHHQVARWALSESFAVAPGSPGSDGVALVFGEEIWTYQRLWGTAAAIAEDLSELGGSLFPVALYFHRDPLFIASLLGVLISGRAFLPLDPGYPEDRLRYMVEDSGADVLLCRRGAAVDTLAGCRRIRALRVEEKTPRKTPGLPPPVSFEQQAYMIYTSGSSGQPKGVVLSHGGWARLVEAQRALLSPQRGARVLQLSALSFDASIFEITMALAFGGTLHLLPDAESASGEALSRLLLARGITHLTITPAALSTLPRRRHSDLRVLICAGEALPPALALRWQSLMEGQMFNAYGPTETTVWATMKKVPQGSVGNPENRQALPIGRPIPEMRAVVLNSSLRPLPVASPGELCLGGRALAQGYHRRPALTAQRFVPDPAAGGSAPRGARLYRTGDRVSWDREGQLVFHGRIDGQLKVRGKRIEPGEIENQLLQYEGVKEAAVTVRRTDASDPATARLLAYLVLERSSWANAESHSSRSPDAPPAGSGLKENAAARDIPEAQLTPLIAWLAARVPRALVPDQWIEVERLPRSPAGKLDREALPPTPVSDAASRRGPRDLLEAKVCGLFAEVLGRPFVSLDEDFFRAGGHSLLAVELVSRSEAVFGVDLPIAVLMDHRSPAAWAKALRRHSGQRNSKQRHRDQQQSEQRHSKQQRAEHSSGSSSSPRTFLLNGTSQDEGSEASWGIVHPIGGEVLSYLPLAHALGDRLSPTPRLLGLRCGVEEAGLDLPGLARVHLQTLFAEVGGAPRVLVGWSMGAAVAFEMALQLEERGSAASHLVMLDPPDPDPAVHRAALESGVLLEAFAEDLARGFGERMPQRGQEAWETFREELSEVSSRDFYSGQEFEKLWLRVDHEGWLPEGVGQAVLEERLKIFEANLRRLAEYRPAQRGRGGPLLRETRVEIMVATQDRDASDIERATHWARWARWAQPIWRIEADHYSLLQSPAVIEVAEGIVRRLEVDPAF